MLKGKLIFLAGMFLFFCMASFAGNPVILPIPKETKNLNEEITVSALAVCDHENSMQSKIGIEEITKRLRDLTGKQDTAITGATKIEKDKFNILLSDSKSKNETVQKFIKDNGVSKLPDKSQGYIISFGKTPEWKNSVLIMGFDNVGTLYGCISFKKMFIKSGNEIKLCKLDIYDFPDFEYRELGDMGQSGIPVSNKPDKAKLLKMAKIYIDEMLDKKVNAVQVGKNIIPGMGQQNIMRFDENVFKELDWAKEAIEYGNQRGIFFSYFGTSAITSEKEAENNSRYKDMMNLKRHLFTWSDDELIKQRAEDIGKQCKYLGIKLIFIHYPDTVNENWVNRSKMDRERFGDDRAKADANVTNIFYKALKGIDSSFVFSPLVHPYTAFYIKNEYYVNFLKNFAALIPPDARPAFREFDTEPFRKMAAIYKGPYFLYYEPNRSIFQGSKSKRLGIDRSMVATSVRFFKSFDNGRRDNILMDIWVYKPVDFNITNQFAWNATSPGYDENYTWMHRLTPYDGDGNEDFFSKTLFPVCTDIFGKKAAPEMLKLFRLKILTAFLLQPFAISENTMKMYNSEYSSKLPPIDFNKIIKEQAERIIEADKIVTELSRHPEYFPLESQQKEFTRYYKEVKLLRWLVPVNLRKWEAVRLINEGKIEDAKKEINMGFNAIEDARKNLKKEITVIQSKFKDDFPGSVRSVPCGPNASNTWRDEYLDKYFKDELNVILKNIDIVGRKKKGELLSASDMALVNQKSIEALKSSTELKMNGKFDEDVWKKAVAKPFLKVLKKGDKDLFYPDAKGEAKAAWDDKNLYFALTFYETDIDSMVGTTGERDRHFFADDIFEIFIQPSKDGAYGHFLSNVSGRKWDCVPKKTNFGFENDFRWNPDWETAIFIDYENRKWQAEVKIPFDSFSKEFFDKISVPKSRDLWKLNIGRERRTIEYSSIAPCASFHDQDKYFDLKFEEKK